VEAFSDDDERGQGPTPVTLTTQDKDLALGRVSICKQCAQCHVDSRLVALQGSDLGIQEEAAPDEAGRCDSAA